MARGSLAGFMVLALGIPLAALVWQLVNAGLDLGADFVIRRRGRDRVVIRGRIARGKVLAIREFCARDLADMGPFAVRGRWGPGRLLQLRWSGRLDSGQRQRVRNFLVEVLR